MDATYGRLTGSGQTARRPPTESTPVILLTALPALQGEQQGMKLGVIHYITKPWLPGTVEATVRVALREAQPNSGKEDDDSAVWAGSTSYHKMLEDQADQQFIQTADLLLPLEKMLGGGISLGTLTLIEGALAAGKSVLCQHLAYGALAAGHSVVYFTSEHTAHSLIQQMASIGLDVSRHLRSDALCIYPVQEPIEGEDSGLLMGALALDMDRLPKEYSFIIVDAITNLAGSSQEQAIFSLFSSLRRQCSKGRTIAAVAHSYAFSADMFARLGTLCDAHFRLRTGKVRMKQVRILEVAKANGIDLDRDNVIVFEVEPKSGMHIMPFSQARA